MDSMKKYVLGGLLVFVLLTVLGFASGEIQAVYNRTVGVDVSSSETDKFHASKGYVDGMVQDLSKYKLEFAQSSDDTAKQAIVAHINEEFANFDETQIKDKDLKQFLIDCRNGKNK
jgi:hypothetical protein